MIKKPASQGCSGIPDHFCINRREKKQPPCTMLRIIHGGQLWMGSIIPSSTFLIQLFSLDEFSCFRSVLKFVFVLLSSRNHFSLGLSSMNISHVYSHTICGFAAHIFMGPEPPSQWLLEGWPISTLDDSSCFLWSIFTGLPGLFLSLIHSQL